MKTTNLYWAYSSDHRCQAVFADHPAVGRLFMGRTMAEARTCAQTCDWL